MIPNSYLPQCRRGINGCWNCEHSFEDFDLYCFKTAESARILFMSEAEDLGIPSYSTVQMFYVNSFDICEDYSRKDVTCELVYKGASAFQGEIFKNIV